jgi:hypothetical protein
MDADLASAEWREKRCGIDRRHITYDLHIPERRSGKDRRSGKVWLNSVRFPMSSQENDRHGAKRRLCWEG